MDDYSPWGALAKMEDVRIEYADLDDELGWWDPDRRVITLDKRQSQRERRCTLAHELAHVERGDENVSHVSPILAARQEIAACVRAARRLIPLEALVSALLWSQDERELAEELNVDEDTVRIRLLTLSEVEHKMIDRRLLVGGAGNRMNRFACPNCAGSQLRPARTPMTRLFLGFLAPRNKIRCLDCRMVVDPRTGKIVRGPS